MGFIQKISARWRALPPRIHLFIGVGALMLLGVFLALFFLRPSVAPIERETFDAPVPPITVSSSYEDGTHTIEGTVTLRNRCQRLDALATLDEASTPSIIRVDITSEHDEGICLEIPDTREFSLTLEGPEEAQIEVFVNGIPQSGTAL